MTDRTVDVWGPRTPHPRDTAWPVRVDIQLADGLTEADVDRWVRSACVLCSNGCGCEIAVKDGVMVGVRGVGTDAVNHGGLGPKGLSGSWPWASSSDRLTTPLVRDGGRLRPASWDEAMGRIVAESRRILREKGPLGIGFYTSGQLFLEEYDTLAVIGKAGLGTPHGPNGDLPGFRNWDDPEHIVQLAELWNVEDTVVPHWAPPTHAMQIFRYAEQGSIDLLWISATNPAVSMPDLARVRRVLTGDACFVVAQDAFLTETARLADVVLPAAGWGERTGTYTNVNRTVHLSDQAVEPPGEARSDLDIFLAYADAMDFREGTVSPRRRGR